MFSTKIKDKWFPALIIVSFLLVVLIFGNLLLKPSQYLFSNLSDVLNNYYTLTYYAEHCEGMQLTSAIYPYGENMLFTDNEPVLSLILSFINHHIVGLHGNEYVILNLILIFSFCIAMLVVYKLLRHYKLPGWYAFIFAPLIVSLSPQVLRYTAHLSLTYIFFIPALWLLLIQFEQSSRKWMQALFIALYLLWFTFIHVYYLAMGGLLVFAYTFVRWLMNLRHSKKSGRENLYLLGAALLPFAFFYLFLFLTDHVKDRPADPWGFFAYAATMQGLFTSPYSPFSKFYSLFKNYAVPELEAQSYLGIAAIAGMLNAIIIVWIHRKRRSAKHAHRKRESTLLHFLIASILLLILAMAIPFKWNMEWLLDFIKPLKQFRAPGRLAWPFYFAATTLSVIYFYKLYRILRIKRLSILAVSILILIAAVWSAEAYSYLKATIIPLQKNKVAIALFGDQGNYKELLSQAGFSKDQFQAIMSFPYYQHGSEKLYIYGSNGSLYEAEKASLNLSLPIVNGYVTRTSIDQSLSLVQLLSSPMIKKEVIKDFPDQRPLLLIVSKEPGVTYRENELYLVSKASLIKETDGFSLYSLPLVAFDDTISHVKNFISNHLNEFSKISDYYSTGGRQDVVIKHFDENKAEQTLFTKGAMYIEKGFVDVYSDTIPFARDSTMYEASIWFYTNKKRNSFPWINYWQYDAGNNTVEQKNAEGKVSTEVFDNWVRISFKFLLVNKHNRIVLRIDGNQEQIIDELLIRPLNTHVYIPSENGKFYYDNYPIE